MKEFFGAGTACVVCPVEKILYKSQWLDIPTMSKGAPLTMRMYNALLDIQVNSVQHTARQLTSVQHTARHTGN